ncbi:hypothetical protein BQ8482_360026 [Mesorhizobium delmotii]|uniref:Uncharacterized protein n=1 Tax=Mesorhizobium delmotii TaxID=1631247 RepID=A0A2P9AR45_9HYPH|nr:hypothetical protein BQ8482_360026 [Mesorhizobium delmotii]
MEKNFPGRAVVVRGQPNGKSRETMKDRLRDSAEVPGRRPDSRFSLRGVLSGGWLQGRDNSAAACAFAAAAMMALLSFLRTGSQLAR